MADTTFLKDNLQGAVPTEVATELVKNIVTESTVFKVCRYTPMTSDKKTIPVLTDTGKAHWTGEGEKIKTSLMGYDYPMLKAKKLAVIIPVTKEKLNDSAFDVISELKDGIKDAFVRAIDGAVLFGTDTPFEQNIVGEILEENKVTLSKDLGQDISSAMGKVENSDLEVSSILAPPAYKQKFRDLRDINKQPLVSNGAIFDTSINYAGGKSWDKTKAGVILGDFTKAIIGTRDNIEYEILKEATVGGVNLAEQDLIAVKCTMRFGFVIADKKAFSLVKEV